MAITYHSGGRIQGTSTDFAGTPAISGGWKEVARTTLGSAGDALTVSSIPDKRYYMILYNAIPSGEMTEYMTMGNGSKDTGSNYANRKSTNGGAEGVYSSRSNIIFSAKSGGTQPELGVGYIANKSDKEKLLTHHGVNASSSGAGTAPERIEVAGKWANTSDVMDVISFDNTGSGDYASGSECVVLGWDETDTHTTNFWEELASVDLSSTSSTIDSGTITAKKYLWVQLFNAGNSSGEEQLTFNSDTGSNYGRRGSANGATDFTTVNDSNIENMFTGGSATNKSFANGFIINNSANEKLVISNVILNNTAGAGTAPTRMESVSKWANTSSQITKLTFTSSAGTFSAGSFLKVWGSN